MTNYMYNLTEPSGHLNDETRNTGTSFGLAGSGGLYHFRYCNVNLELKFEINSEGLWFIINESSASLRNTGIAQWENDGYPCVYLLYNKPFTLELNSDGDISGFPPQEKILWESQATIPVHPYSGRSVGDFYWDPINNNSWQGIGYSTRRNLGDPYDVFEWDSSSEYTGDGYLYLGGCSFGYPVGDSKEINAMKLRFNGIRNYFDYFPGAIYDINKNLHSCNRSGGYFRKLSKTGYQNRKNVSTNTSGSTVFIHDGSGFNTIAPLIGDV